MRLWLVEDPYELQNMIVHRVYEHQVLLSLWHPGTFSSHSSHNHNQSMFVVAQRWSRKDKAWTGDALDMNEPPFAETHDGGATARNFCAIRSILEAELTEDHTTTVHWSFNTTDLNDAEGWSYTDGRIDAIEWYPGSFARARTRRRVWYQVSTHEKHDGNREFGAHVPIDSKHHVSTK
jgi:hypothetical protein